MLSKYSKLLETDPLKTKMTTTGILYAIGDLICQLYFSEKQGNERPKINWRRIIKMTLIGALFECPIIHAWYGFVSKLIEKRFPHFSGFKKALASMALDQTVLTLPFSFVMLFGIDWLDHFQYKKSLKMVLDIYWGYIVKNWAVWAPAMLINFALIPTKYQNLFSDAVGFFWNIYVSYIANKGNGSDSEEIKTKKE